MDRFWLATVVGAVAPTPIMSAHPSVCLKLAVAVGRFTSRACRPQGCTSELEERSPSLLRKPNPSGSLGWTHGTGCCHASHSCVQQLRNRTRSQLPTQTACGLQAQVSRRPRRGNPIKGYLHRASLEHPLQSGPVQVKAWGASLHTEVHSSGAAGRCCSTALRPHHPHLSTGWHNRGGVTCARHAARRPDEELARRW